MILRLAIFIFRHSSDPFGVKRKYNTTEIHTQNKCLLFHKNLRVIQRRYAKLGGRRAGEKTRTYTCVLYIILKRRLLLLHIISIIIILYSSPRQQATGRITQNQTRLPRAIIALIIIMINK